MAFMSGFIIVVSALVGASNGFADEPVAERMEAVAAQAGLPSALPGLSAVVPAVPEAKTLEPEASGLKPLFLVNGDFEDLGPFDTGYLAHRCTNLSPWGNTGWGINAGTFLRADDTHTLANTRLRVFHDGQSQVAGIFAKEDRGVKMGFARFVQGDSWGGTFCPSRSASSDGGPIGWGKPSPLLVSGRRLGLKIDVRNDEVRKFSSRARRGWFGGTSHVMMAFNIWLSSPRLGKRAVMDLAVVHDCNWGAGNCGPNTGEDPLAYHYIVHIDGKDQDSPKGKWTRWIIDLSKHVKLAADRFGWDQSVRDSLSITQVEFLIEVMDGQGSVLFDNVHLVEVPQGVAIRDASMPLPAPAGADPLPIAARNGKLVQ